MGLFKQSLRNGTCHCKIILPELRFNRIFILDRLKRNFGSVPFIFSGGPASFFLKSQHCSVHVPASSPFSLRMSASSSTHRTNSTLSIHRVCPPAFTHLISPSPYTHRMSAPPFTLWASSSPSHSSSLEPLTRLRQETPFRIQCCIFPLLSVTDSQICI